MHQLQKLKNINAYMYFNIKSKKKYLNLSMLKQTHLFVNLLKFSIDIVIHKSTKCRKYLTILDGLRFYSLTEILSEYSILLI